MSDRPMGRGGWDDNDEIVTRSVYSFEVAKNKWRRALICELPSRVFPTATNYILCLYISSNLAH